MGGYDDVGHGNQPHQLVILHDVTGVVFVEQVPFFLVHIQTGSADLSVLNAGDQILGVHQRAPGGIDDGDALFHHGDGLGVDDVAGFLGEGAVQGDDVGLFKQLLQFHIV